MSEKMHARGRAVVLLAMGLAAGTASATIYTDNTGATDHYSDSYADIANVVITNDATNLNITINLNPVANDGVTPTNIQNNNFTRYDIGFQTGLGGNTGLTEPFGQSMGISTGQNYNLESWANQNAAPSTLGGYSLQHWNGASWDVVGTSSTDTVFPTGKSLTVPLASLGLADGSTFFFDVWTTFGGGNGAYDALFNDSLTTQPFGTIVPYDSATAAGTRFGTQGTSYTVVIVPEPVSLATLGAFGLLTLSRRRSHK
ncbi:MAG TPA: hypothetical protein VH518_14515 [Tepidisphaeraceae bacterium]|jgi:hypothetical protein